MGKALVTGSRGFSGSHMLDLLIREGWDVVATDLPESERSEYYTDSDAGPSPVYETDLEAEEHVEFIGADLTDKDSLRPIFEDHDIEVVFHIASIFDYFADREKLFAVNVEGARNLVDLAIEEDVDHFVHWSTLGVIGDAGFDSPDDESADYNPHNNYCESKVEEEKLVLDKRDEGLPVTVLRPAPIYGPRHRYGVYHLPRILSKFGFAPVFSMYPKKKQPMFPCVHIDDLTRMSLFVNERKSEAEGEVYNAVSDCIPQDDLIEFIADAVDVRKTRLPMPFPLYKVLTKIAQYATAKLDKAARKRGTRPKVDAPVTNYTAHNMWFSNQKIIDLGFDFKYKDPRKGLWDYITWAKSEGLVE